MTKEMADALKDAYPYQIALEDYKIADDSDPDNVIEHCFWTIVAMFSNKLDADNCLKTIDVTHPGSLCKLFDYTQINQQPDVVSPVN